LIDYQYIITKKQRPKGVAFFVVVDDESVAKKNEPSCMVRRF
jgi:hypothetical protein